MKLKILLFCFFCTSGCINADAAGTEPGIPRKVINEVSGNVLDADSQKPLSEVTVTAFLVSKKEKYDVTDESGRFDFDELKSGMYKLVFEKEGYRKVIKDKVSIKTDETFQMRIEMVETSDFDFTPSPFYFTEN